MVFCFRWLYRFVTRFGLDPLALSLQAGSKVILSEANTINSKLKTHHLKLTKAVAS
jgi:hypothetical protein